MEDMVSQVEVDEIRTDLFEAVKQIETMVPKDDYTKIQSELDEANRKTDALEQRVEYFQEQNDGLTEMILKKREAEEQLKAYQYDEVEGSWVEYSGEGYGPVRLSLN